MVWIVFWSLFFIAIMVSDICDAYVKTHSKNNNNNNNKEDDYMRKSSALLIYKENDDNDAQRNR